MSMVALPAYHYSNKAPYTTPAQEQLEAQGPAYNAVQQSYGQRRTCSKCLDGLKTLFVLVLVAVGMFGPFALIFGLSYGLKGDDRGEMAGNKTVSNTTKPDGY